MTAEIQRAAIDANVRGRAEGGGAARAQRAVGNGQLAGARIVAAQHPGRRAVADEIAIACDRPADGVVGAGKAAAQRQRIGGGRRIEIDRACQ